MKIKGVWVKSPQQAKRVNINKLELFVIKVTYSFKSYLLKIFCNTGF